MTYINLTSVITIVRRKPGKVGTILVLKGSRDYKMVSAPSFNYVVITSHFIYPPQHEGFHFLPQLARSGLGLPWFHGCREQGGDAQQDQGEAR